MKTVRKIVDEIIACNERHSQGDQVGGLYPEDILIDYLKQLCKKQMQKCRGIYSANRHKTPIEIKEEIRKATITKFE